MEDLIDDGEGSLDGDHTFAQFNPAIGMSYQVNDDSDELELGSNLHVYQALRN